MRQVTRRLAIPLLRRECRAGWTRRGRPAEWHKQRASCRDSAPLEPGYVCHPPTATLQSSASSTHIHTQSLTPATVNIIQLSGQSHQTTISLSHISLTHRHRIDKYLDTLFANQTAQKARQPITPKLASSRRQTTALLLP